MQHRPRHGHDRQAQRRGHEDGAGSAVALQAVGGWAACHDPGSRRDRRRSRCGKRTGFHPQGRGAWGAPIRVLSGEEEARLAAEGVLAGIPDADGLAADLAAAASTWSR
ncbi:MAG: hypothetical protein WDM89_15370 [Rhizomicrobium sp.]